MLLVRIENHAAKGWPTWALSTLPLTRARCSILPTKRPTLATQRRLTSTSTTTTLACTDVLLLLRIGVRPARCCAAPLFQDEHLPIGR